MKLTNDEVNIEDHVIISYSHDDKEIVEKELDKYNNEEICYWYDGEMTYGSNTYVKQFRDILDSNKCKGVIFFISQNFLISDPCGREMLYYKEKYANKNSEKFCLFVALPDMVISGLKEGIDKIFTAIWPYAESAERLKEHSTLEKMELLRKQINLFCELVKNGEEEGEALIGMLGGDYIERSCKKGQLFDKAGIIHKVIDCITLGYFPQNEQQINCEINETMQRQFDKDQSYYAPIDWLVIADNKNSGKYTSKKLLLSIDYLSTKYPIDGSNKKVSEIIKDTFFRYFKYDDKKWKISSVRFLQENELKILLARSQKDISQQEKKKREILFPEVTHFSRISSRKTTQAFWLAGDMEDARRVDTGTESLSDQPAGVELFYVRVVIEVEKC